ncbi:MAG: glycosyltransferase [Bacteroidaceae bacterium]|nr:glycosyltransferase [Bacteroidaceae bacterium]MEA5099361.1 glycosyltransferase [Bacteroidales bacterium]
MKLSIVIVNYNVAYFLEHCLYSVRNALKGIEAEIFVVDNNSVDNSIAMLKEKFPEVILIANKDNVGFSRANNQAIRISKGEYVLILNPDTVVEEDTFAKCISFMDSHKDCGALGVKMIDGSGKFLKESKRGFPSPWTSFCKMSGLTSLFPHSKKYANYYMGHLSEDEVNEVDILAGAYMMMRKECLDKVGLLDEDYFMYGEDIDLSYRITKGGYKNYYFPKARIIHYKGESTKKASMNYVYTFYNAMVIFAQKHLTKKQTKLFSTLIKLAIWLRAGFAFCSRIFKNSLLPLLDFVLVYLAYYLLVSWWSVNIWEDANYYPLQYIYIVVPIYIFIWLLSIYLSGGYSKPIRIPKIISGVFFGMITILVFYSLLPEQLRYSRALVLLGAVVSLFIIISIRLVYRYFSTGSWLPKDERRKRYIIIGDETEAVRVADLLRTTDAQAEFIGLTKEDDKETDNPNFVGNISQIKEIIKIYQINEVIFCAKSISQQRIISTMAELKADNLHFIIAPPETDFIIGSNTINTPTDLYVISVNSISDDDNKRKKRLLDITLALFTLLFSPILCFTIKRPIGLWKNTFSVLFGSKTWIGYSNTSTISNNSLPKIKKGILTTQDSLDKKDVDLSTLNRLNLLYARNYRLQSDFNTFIKAFREIGRN